MTNRSFDPSIYPRIDPFVGLDLLASAVIVLNQQAAIVYANPAAESLLKRPSKLLLQQNLHDLFQNG
ncbi:MAG: PAS domain-containing protein, partial [Undibacterium sp.]|nr:PAS domain-containing protein [Undibacterium sp.]